jgi:DnaJ-domain-containing protein 1
MVKHPGSVIRFQPKGFFIMTKAAPKSSARGSVKGSTGRVKPASAPSDRAAVKAAEVAEAKAELKANVEAARKSLLDSRVNDVITKAREEESESGLKWLKLGEALHNALYDPETGRDRVHTNKQPMIYRQPDANGREGKGPPVPGLEAIADCHPTVRSSARRMFLLNDEWSNVPDEAYRITEDGDREPRNQRPPGLKHEEINIKIGWPTHVVTKYAEKLREFKKAHGWDGAGKDRKKPVVDRNVEAALRVRYLVEPQGRTLANALVRERLLIRLADAMARAKMGKVMDRLLDEVFVEVKTSMGSSTVDERTAKKALKELHQGMETFVEEEKETIAAHIAAAEEDDGDGPSDDDEGEVDEPKGGRPAAVAEMTRRMDALEEKLGGAGEPGPEENGNTYEILGVSLKATQPTVNKRYKRLVEDATDAERQRLVNAYLALCSERGWTPNAEG